MNKRTLSVTAVNDILQKLPDDQKLEKNMKLIEQLYMDYQKNECDDRKDIERLANEFNALLFGKIGPNHDEKNKVTSIAGVRFGETRTNTINAFKQRGTFLKSEDKITYFSNVNFGGSTYNMATLFFQYNSKRFDMTLAAAKFEKNFYEWPVVSQFQGKYTNCTVLKDEEDYKAMVCGMLDDSYEDGKMPPIIVSFELGVSRGGDKFYYVSVSYFGYRMSNVASDDI